MNALTIRVPGTTETMAPFPMGGRSPRGSLVGANRLHFTRGGQPWLPAMGEFQYSRYPVREWENELRKMKAGGIEIVATYVIWIHHEEEEGVFDWSGCRDLRRFVTACARHGLWVALRIGPFCHGEVRNGGLPDWLYGQALRPRTNDPRYLRLAARLYGEIARQMRGLLFRDGGPTLAIQCENEFMDSAAPWETTQIPAVAYTPKGSGGVVHMRALKRLARAVGLDVPFWTATGWGASPVRPRDFLPLFGGYAFHAWLDDPTTQPPSGCFLFSRAHGRPNPKFDTRTAPYACCELGGGMQVFYRNRPVVPPESVEAMHVAQLGSGANLMGYYVYHGGRNPVGRRAFLNEHRCPRISYDYQAPLGEGGQRRPHYALLRRQFLFLHSFGAQLAPMETYLPARRASGPADTATVRWAVRARGDAGFLFVHNYQDHVALRTHHDVAFRVRGPHGVTAFDPLVLRPGACAILPFGLDLGGGLRLAWSTCQPLAWLDDTLFCFAPEGFPAVYVFDPPTRRSAGPEPAAPGRFEVTPGRGRLVLTRPDQTRLTVVTLTDAESRRFWIGRAGSRDRAFLSSAGLLFGARTVRAYQEGNPRMRVAVYQPEAGFVWHTCRARRRTVRLTIRRIAADRVVVRLPRRALDGLEELRLRVDYVGDTAAAYLDGQLVADNFWNGATWEIALRRLAPRVLTTELVLVLTPRTTGTAAAAYSEMAAVRVAASTPTSARFVRIRAVPEYAGEIRV
jgi:hypothetical protein